jgi:hypothetical protein
VSRQARPVAGLTTWIPFDNSSAAQDFTLNGSGQLFANGGFDISSNLNNDTLTLDKVVSIGGLSSWGDASFATSIIAGTGSFINNGDIDVFNTVQLTVGVDIVNNAEISKNSGVGVLELSGNLTMNPGSKLTVFEGSTVSLSGGAGTLLLTNTAGFGGGGTLNGNVNSTGGVIDIENSTGTPGTLTINGALTLDSISTLLFDLGGTVQGVSHDFLNVTGNVNLDGTLALFWTNGFTASNSDTFDLILTGGAFGGAGINTIIDPAGVITSTAIPVASTFQYTTVSVMPNIVFWDDGGLAGDWLDGLNWSGDLVPLNTDNVFIDGADLVINIAGVADANTLSLASGYSLVLNSGSLTIASDSTLDGDLTINGGNFTGSGNIVLNGAFNWTGGNLTGTGLLITNASSTLNSPGSLTLSRSWTNNGTVNWDNGSMVINSLRTFTNTGIFNSNAAATFTVSGGADTFVNQNLINVNSDTTFNGLGSLDNSGGIVVVGAATLSIATATGTDNGSWDVGAGAININGGTRTFDEGFNVTGTTGSITLSSGTLDINSSSPLFLPAALTFNLSGGTLTGNGGLVVDGSFNWTGSSLTGAGLLTTNGSSTVNQAGGLTLSRSWSNNGTLNWSNGNIVIDSLSTFTNTVTGIFDANAAGTFTISSGSEAFNNQGTLNVNSNTTFNGGGALDMQGGILSGNGDLVLDGGFNWTGGSITGVGLLTTNAASLLNQPGGLVLGRDWTANGAVTWVAGNLAVNNNATLISTGIFNANADGQLISMNTGTIFDNQGDFNLGGNIAINNGALFEHNGGLFDLNGFTLTVTGGLRINTGELGGSGTIAGDLINNGSTIQPGGIDSIGSIAVTNNFTNSAGSVVIDIDNAVTTAGSDYDQLVVGGQADFGGALILNVIGGYSVASNDSFDPITYATYGGTPFANIVPIGGEVITPDYTAPDLTLVLSFSGLFTFTGAVDNSWDNAGNWDQGIPAIGSDTLIPAGFNVTIAAE